MLLILDRLTKAGAEWEVVDPNVPEFRLNGEMVETVALTEEKLKNADLVMIATNHSGVDYGMIAEKSKAIFDTRYSGENFNKVNFVNLLLLKG